MKIRLGQVIYYRGGGGRIFFSGDILGDENQYVTQSGGVYFVRVLGMGKEFFLQSSFYKMSELLGAAFPRPPPDLHFPISTIFHP